VNLSYQFEITVAKKLVVVYSTTGQALLGSRYNGNEQGKEGKSRVCN